MSKMRDTVISSHLIIISHLTGKCAAQKLKKTLAVDCSSPGTACLNQNYGHIKKPK